MLYLYPWHIQQRSVLACCKYAGRGERDYTTFIFLWRMLIQPCTLVFASKFRLGGVNHESD
jgi:hypothetical protein